ncbi:hypothetical protein AB0H36_04965 [Kribbella sp. NPDC050820]|uniref:hypothetical protein n=1 Tax=Kribbella sp. NPDC050820 TaxID=3155408 RepID=UPI0033DAE56D
MISVTVDRRRLEDPLVAFDEYLGRVRGVCAGTRRNYVEHVRAFLQAVLVGAAGTGTEIGPREVGSSSVS